MVFCEMFQLGMVNSIVRYHLRLLPVPNERVNETWDETKLHILEIEIINLDKS